MKIFFKKLSEFVQDDTGACSAMRLLFIIWGLGAFIVWVILSFKTGTMVSIPWSITSFISSLVAGKVVQSYTENVTTPPTQEIKNSTSNDSSVIMP